MTGNKVVTEMVVKKMSTFGGPTLNNCDFEKYSRWTLNGLSEQGANTENIGY